MENTASRTEYTLGTIGCFIAFVMFTYIFNPDYIHFFSTTSRAQSETIAGIIALIYTALTIFLIISLINLTRRRLRDAGINQWSALLILVPYINIIFMLTLALTPPLKQQPTPPHPQKPQ